MIRRTLAVAALLLTLTAGLASAKEEKEIKYQLTLVEELPVPGLREPSGLTYSASRGTLFAVGDEGQVAEISLSGEILHTAQLGNLDLEGVTIRQETDELYVLDERTSSLLLLDADSLALKDQVSLGTEYGPFEGLSMDTEGRFYISEQKTHIKKATSGILILSASEEPRYLETGILDQAAVFLHGDVMYILCDNKDKLYCLTREGKKLWHCKVEGNMQEGFAIDGEGLIYIAQDAGGILKMRLEEKEEKK